MSYTNPLPKGIRQVVPDYVSDGTTVALPIPFIYYDPTDVYIGVQNPALGVWQTLTLNVDYTLSPAKVETGGTATLAVAQPVGFLLRVQGLRSPSRTTSVTNAGAVISGALETELDVVEATMAELRRDVNNAVFPAASVATAVAAAAGAALSATQAANASRLTAGAVTGLPAGSLPGATITGAAGAQQLNLQIPQGQPGVTAVLPGPQYPSAAAGVATGLSLGSFVAGTGGTNGVFTGGIVPAQNGGGSATYTLTVAGGVITSLVINLAGSNYNAPVTLTNAQLAALSPGLTGASATLLPGGGVLVGQPFVVFPSATPGAAGDLYLCTATNTAVFQHAMPSIDNITGCGLVLCQTASTGAALVCQVTTPGIKIATNLSNALFVVTTPAAANPVGGTTASILDAQGNTLLANTSFFASDGVTPASWAGSQTLMFFRNATGNLQLAEAPAQNLTRGLNATLLSSTILTDAVANVWPISSKPTVLIAVSAVRMIIRQPVQTDATFRQNYTSFMEWELFNSGPSQSPAVAQCWGISRQTLYCNGARWDFYNQKGGTPTVVEPVYSWGRLSDPADDAHYPYSAPWHGNLQWNSGNFILDGVALASPPAPGFVYQGAVISVDMTYGQLLYDGTNIGTRHQLHLFQSGAGSNFGGSSSLQISTNFNITATGIGRRACYAHLQAGQGDKFKAYPNGGTASYAAMDILIPLGTPDPPTNPQLGNWEAGTANPRPGKGAFWFSANPNFQAFSQMLYTDGAGRLVPEQGFTWGDTTLANFIETYRTASKFAVQSQSGAAPVATSGALNLASLYWAMNGPTLT